MTRILNYTLAHFVGGSPQEPSLLEPSFPTRRSALIWDTRSRATVPLICGATAETSIGVHESYQAAVFYNRTRPR